MPVQRWIRTVGLLINVWQYGWQTEKPLFSRWQRWLLRDRRSRCSPLGTGKAVGFNFQRIGLLDREATITAYFPLFDELGQDTIGKSYADRPFVPTLKRTLKPMLSEMVMGKVGIAKPIVLLIAPVVVRGEYDGYVAGTLSLEQIKEYLDRVRVKVPYITR